MKPRKEALILKAIEEYRRYAGRHLLADVDEAASGLVAYLHERATEADCVAVGSVRRGTEIGLPLIPLSSARAGEKSRPPRQDDCPIWFHWPTSVAICTHTEATHGGDLIETMVKGARAAGLSYLAITDHSRSLAVTGGLDERAALDQARRIRAISRTLDGMTLMAGIECDILPDGRLDLAEDCLAELDLVIASVHTAFNQDEAQMTDRILRALESPVVDILGHPTGRLLLRREAYAVNMERVIDTAARVGVMLEISSQIDRLDLNDRYARLARKRGAKLVINTDAHSARGFRLLRWGVTVARRAWLEPDDIANTRPVDAFRRLLRRAAC